MRRFLKYLVALLLRHAAQHRELLTLGLQLFIVLQPMEDLLFRLITNGAGVVEDQARFLHGFHLPVTLAHKSADHFLGIVYVHLAAEGLNVEGLWLARGLGSLWHCQRLPK